jgi:two-component system sensor histidine kinase PilS (NtrC family)
MKNQGEHNQKELLNQLNWLMFFRVIVSTLMLSSSILLQIKKIPSPLTPFLTNINVYIIIITIFFLTFIYAITIKKIKNLTAFAYIQITLDTFLITFLIYSTGGKDSMFSFLYTISIITASILLYRKGGFYIASVCSILYGGFLDIEFYGMIPSPSKPFLDKDYNSTDLFFTILINIIAFYLVAYLSSLLSRQVLVSRKELKKKQLDFDQLEAFNRNIVMSINSGLLTTDIEGRITFFNKAAEEITGYGFSDVYNTIAEDTFPFLKDKKDGAIEPLTYKDMHSLRYESQFKKQNGDTLYLGFSTSLLKDTMEKDIGKIIIFQDLTMFKEMEDHIKLVDRLAAVGRLSAGIAHEMRNPLASVSGSIQVLKEELQLEGQQQRLMDIAINETDRLDSLITDFMLFAQPGLGKKEDVVITKVIGDTLNDITNSHEWNNDIEVRWDISSHIKVEADPKQLRHVFWNIFINAVQAMPEGGELLIKVRDLDSTNNILQKMTESLEIVIADTGCGIPEENLDNIFDPFFTTRDRGTGMGLAIAYRIIESYNGKIVVKSEPGRRTSFSIYLPIASL